MLDEPPEDGGPDGSPPREPAAAGPGIGAADPDRRQRSPRPPREPAYSPQGYSLLLAGAKGAGLLIAVIPLVAILLIFRPWTAAETPQYPDQDTSPYNNSLGGQYPNDGDNDGDGFGGDAATTAPPSDPTDTDTATAQATDPADEAVLVTQILQAAANDRGQVVAAVSDAERCGSGTGFSADENTVQQAQSDQQDLSSQASNLDLSALDDTGQLAGDLSTALTDSATADGDFASWIQDLSTDGCSGTTATQDPDYNAAGSDGDQATAAKNTLVALWNPIAQRYGQPTWSASQI